MEQKKMAGDSGMENDGETDQMKNDHQHLLFSRALYRRLREIGMNDQQAESVPDETVKLFTKGKCLLWAVRTNKPCTECKGFIFLAGIVRPVKDLNKFIKP